MSQRSEPGQGENVAIYMLDVVDDNNGATEIWSGIDEDFADSHWPVVVKVKRSLPQAQLVQALTNLLACVRQSIHTLDEFELADERSAPSRLLGHDSIAARDAAIETQCHEVMARARVQATK